jgi:hypothetical protein
MERCIFSRGCIEDVEPATAVLASPVDIDDDDEPEGLMHRQVTVADAAGRVPPPDWCLLAGGARVRLCRCVCHANIRVWSRVRACARMSSAEVDAFRTTREWAVHFAARPFRIDTDDGKSGYPGFFPYDMKGNPIGFFSTHNMHIQIALLHGGRGLENAW